MLRHYSINLKRGLKRANINISSGCQGMRRQEEVDNDVRLRQNENTNKKDSPMFSMNGARAERLPTKIGL
jgi:hypothetical protein